MRRNLAAVIVLSTAGLAYAQEPPPEFRAGAITNAEWNQYLDAVRALPNVREFQDAESVNFISLHSDAGLVYLFTKVGHAAHPCALRLSVKIPGELEDIQVLGHYAGSRKACSSWIGQKKRNFAAGFLDGAKRARSQAGAPQ